MFYCVKPSYYEDIIEKYEAFYNKTSTRQRKFIETPDEFFESLYALGRFAWEYLDENNKTKAILLTSQEKCGIEKYVLIHSVVGENPQMWFLEVIQTIESWAKSIGCESVKILARKGWLRFLKEYKPTRILIERNI